MNAPMKKIMPTATRVSKRRIALMSGPNPTPVSFSSTVPLSQISGIVYAKPNVMNNPPKSCKFWWETSANTTIPTTLDHIYATAAGATPGTAVDSDHSGWPPHVSKTALDVNLHTMGFTHGQYVAIAFNIDDTVNNDPTYTYGFECASPTFDPSQAIQETDANGSLAWIDGDDFTRCVNASNVGKTVVVVCAIAASATFKFVPFDLSVTAVNGADPDDNFTTVFDPKIRNDG